MVGLSRSKKRVIKILHDINGIIKPSRMTPLLGPPGSGKTTLLKALAGKSDDNLKISGKVTYCGREFKEFVPQRTSVYIIQHDLHYGEMTVRETLDFSGRCLGVRTRYEMMVELSRREKEAGIKPDPEIDAFMKATAVSGQETSLITDFVLKGIDIKEMLVGASLMDEANRTTMGMARNLGFLVLILSVIFVCEAMIFHPISESHRFAALELFTPLHGSFGRYSLA